MSIPQRSHRLGALLALLLLALAVAPGFGANASALVNTRLNAGVATIPSDVAVGGLFHGATVVGIVSDIGLITVTTPYPDDFRAAASTDPNVRYVVEDKNLPFITEAFTSSAPTLYAKGLSNFNPNDPEWTRQYGPSLIRADAVWRDWKGSMSSNLCILDSGLRYTHEDLAPNYRGGYGYAQRFDGKLPTDPWDDQWHGTVVAGLAAASVNNGKGIAGVGNVGLYVVKVLDKDNNGLPSGIAAGIMWCVNNAGPRTVISMSLGMPPVFNGLPSEPLMLPVHDAVVKARARGAILVAAAGNDACSDCVHFPARYDEVIAVGCVDSKEARCSNSNGGPSLDLMAPGWKIHSTMSSGDTGYATDFGGATSWAVPHVSGAIALAWSARTACSGDTMDHIARITAKDLGTSGADDATGMGLVDAKALYDNALCGSTGGGSGKPLLSDAQIIDAARFSRLSAN